MISLLISFGIKHFSSIVKCLLVIVVFFYGYFYGHGKAKDEFDKYLQAQKEETVKLQEEYLVHAQEYQIKVQELADEVRDQEIKYQTKLNNLEHNYTNRLRKSEQRASYYQSMSSNSNCTSNNLANYTTRLDSSLEQGIRVVRELGELVRLRDQQLRKCGEQLKLLTGDKKNGTN